MWFSFLSFLKDNQIGDLTGVFGLFITFIGFAITFIGVFKSKASSERAEKAAKSARDHIIFFDTVVDFTSAITILEEIKRHHRQEQWVLLLDRYSMIRKLLISLKASNADLNDDQKTIIQSALTNLSSIEGHVEKHIERPDQLKASKFNPTISQDIDNLVLVLAQLKSVRSGAKNELV